MGCCGQKRAQLLAEPKLGRRAPASDLQESHEDVDTVQRAPLRQARVFEYLGSDTLTLRGASSGVAYRFTHPGARVEVAFEDSFAMMAERSVRIAA